MELGRLSEEGTAESDTDRLDLGVVGKRIFAELTSDTRLLETTEGHLVAEHVVVVDPDGTGLEEAGAKVETGGERHGTEGYFIQPTIFSNVSEDMKIMQEEIFGPVCSISKFETEEEVIKQGNETTYGLAAAVHTTNLNTAIRVANSLKAGTVWVNNYNMLSYQVPFGGFKESGIGRELGKYALANYTQVKSVRVRLGGALFG